MFIHFSFNKSNHSSQPPMPVTGTVFELSVVYIQHSELPFLSSFVIRPSLYCRTFHTFQSTLKTILRLLLQSQNDSVAKLRCLACCSSTWPQLRGHYTWPVLKHGVPKSSALPDTGNFRRQEAFAFTLKGTSKDKMGKIKHLTAHTAAAFHWNTGIFT
jgi:hypothetical protein